MIRTQYGNIGTYKIDVTEDIENINNIIKYKKIINV